MARTRMMATMALGAALVATGAAAQSVEQLQNRYQMQQTQRSMDQRAFERQVQQDAQSRALQDRVDRQALERQLSTPPLQHLPPAGSLQRY